jgi:hypothetical protein
VIKPAEIIPYQSFARAVAGPSLSAPGQLLVRGTHPPTEVSPRSPGSQANRPAA